MRVTRRTQEIMGNKTPLNYTIFENTVVGLRRWLRRKYIASIGDLSSVPSIHVVPRTTTRNCVTRKSVLFSGLLSQVHMPTLDIHT